MADSNEADVQGEIHKVVMGLRDFLIEKNKRYGNSALQPNTVFSTHLGDPNPAVNNILVRLDDKISRIQNADMLRKNDIIDMLGYLVLLTIAKGWNDFTDLVD